VDLAVSGRKQSTVTITFVIYIPSSSTTVSITSIAATMQDTTSLLAAINTALAAAGLPAVVGEIHVVIAPSTSPSPSPSISEGSNDESSDDNEDLSSGEIAAVVICSVFGAACVVALIVFAQMKSSQRAHAVARSSGMTAQAVETEAAKGGKNAIDSQL
jgi:hypothetical protein